MIRTAQLHPSLDAGDLYQKYAKSDRLQIRSIFAEQTAERLWDILANETPWGLAFNDGETVVQLDAAEVAALNPSDQQRIAQGIRDGAQRGFQFLYNYYPLFAEYFEDGAPHMPLFDFYEFLNSAATLDFLRNVTGIGAIRWADAQATLFRAGHFLKYHTDETPSQRRLVAYVFNFTKGWGRDWGGYLQFFDPEFDIDHAYRPTFNALNLFTIPAEHSVGMVASYAPGNRFSITGWLRGDDPPGPIGNRSGRIGKRRV